MKKALLCVLLLVACAEDGDEETTACLPMEVLAAIDQHATDLAATAAGLAGHPSRVEATGFFLAPGLPAPPALSASFAGPLVMVCSEPLVYDPFCEEGRCSQLECTGRGAGWRNHLWLEQPVQNDGWLIEEVDVSIVWEEGGTGTSFTIETIATAPNGRDASMTANGVMDVDTLGVVERFTELHPEGETKLVYIDDPSGHRGRLTIDDEMGAEVDAMGRLVPADACR
jgi:hypothetical protein